MVQQPDNSVFMAIEEGYQNAITELQLLEERRQDILNSISEIDSNINQTDLLIERHNSMFNLDRIIHTPGQRREHVQQLQSRRNELASMYEPLLAQQEANNQARRNHPAAPHMRPRRLFAEVVPRLNLFRAETPITPIPSGMPPGFTQRRTHPRPESRPLPEPEYGVPVPVINQLI